MLQGDAVRGAEGADAAGQVVIFESNSTGGDNDVIAWMNDGEHGLAIDGKDVIGRR